MVPDSPARMRVRALLADCRATARVLALRVLLVCVPLAVCFAVQIASSVTDTCYACLHGIFPRESRGLSGILVWPFLHFGWGHLVGNASFLFVLSLMVVVRGALDLVVVWVFAQFIGGLGTWATGGTHSVHAGASGVIMGLFGALLFRVVFERSLVALAWAALVAVLYGSLFYIVVPSQAYSWQGHMWGLLGGIVAAAILGGLAWRRARQPPASSRRGIGSDDLKLTPFDDFELERGVSKLTDEESMAREVEASLVTKDASFDDV